MAVTVTLSEHTQELIAQYSEHAHVTLTSPIEASSLINWLAEKPITRPSNPSDGFEFILASLRSQLLHDLCGAMPGDDKAKEEIKESPNVTKLVLLALAGTLLAACEGFDVVSTILMVLSLPSMLILLAGLAFSMVSVTVFYIFDLVQVSQNSGIELKDAPKLLDIYLQQMNEIKAIRRKINTYRLSELSPFELAELELTITMLQKKFHDLIEASTHFALAVNSTQIQHAKIAASVLAGLLYFGGGFCAAQTVGTFFAGLFITAVAPTFWPIVLFSVIVGLAAFALYWYVERPALKKLVSNWFGLSEDKIATLCDKTILDKEEKKLVNLKEKVGSATSLAHRVAELDEKLKQFNRNEEKGSPFPLKTSNNIYAFMANTEQRNEDPEYLEQSFNCWSP